MRKNSPVTAKEIARRTGVTAVTVSKALRGQSDISAETTKRIKKLALELGYFPNYLARNLASHQSKTIGVVVPKIAHFFFSQVIEAMYEVAFENGYELLLAISQENAEREHRHIETLMSMRVDAIVVSVTEETRDSSIFQRARRFGIPLTFFDRIMGGGEYNKVVADDFGGAFAATEQAIKVGYTKIGHIAGYRHTSIGKERLAGYRASLEKHSIPARPEWILASGFGDRDGYEGFVKLYDSKHLPECLFCVSFPVALGVCRAARERGIRIPDDIDIISFGNSNLNQVLAPSISYVEQPTRELGRIALDLTIKNIRARDAFTPQTITLPSRLVLCDTCTTTREPASTAQLRSMNHVGAACV